MLISKNNTALLKERLGSEKEVFCSGLFLSARWMVLSQVATEGMHVVMLPNLEAAEY